MQPGSGEGRRDQATAAGATLRAGRVGAGLSVTDIAWALRIREAHLEAIETGHYDRLPPHPYGSGFVRAYAEYLGLDGEEMVRRFRAEAGAPRPDAALHFPEPVEESAGPRTGVIFVGVLFAFLAYGIWYVSTTPGILPAGVPSLPERLARLLPERQVLTDAVSGVLSLGPGGDSPSAPATEALTPGSSADGARRDGRSEGWESRQISDVREPPSLAREDGDGVRDGSVERAARFTTDAMGGGAGQSPAAPTESPVSEPGPRRPGPDAMAAEPANRTPGRPGAGGQPEPVSAEGTDQAGRDLSGARIVLKATDASWVEIRDGNGTKILSRLLEEGETYMVPERPGLRMTVGNAGGLTLIVDGRALPPLGAAGAVRRGVPLNADHLSGASTTSN